MRDFEYEAPTTLADAVQVLAKPDGRARPLAGGTDLIDQIRVGRQQPDVVVDIKKIPDLNVLDSGAGGLRVGAAVPCYKIYGDETICAKHSALADSARIIGGMQIQSRASLGGNLCNASPAGDSIPSMIALGGIAVIAGPKGKREVPVESFCSGPGRNVLTSGEFLVEIRFPASAARSGSHYRRFIPSNEMDIAVVGVAVSVTLDESKQKIASARIALGAVGPTPIFAKAASEGLAGKPVSEATLEEAANAARAVCSPIDDMRGTKDFRIHVAGVLVRRSLEAALERARS
jgi:carbon-monoxide dehydrogenase medium subunit